MDTNLAPGDFFRYSDDTAPISPGASARRCTSATSAHGWSTSSFNVANTDGAKVISLDAVVSLF